MRASEGFILHKSKMGTLGHVVHSSIATNSGKFETELLKSDVKCLDIQEFFQGYLNITCSTIQEL